MANINKLSDLVSNLQNEPLSYAEIKALDPSSPLCQLPHAALQAIKAQGANVAAILQPDGTFKYKIVTA